MKKIIIWVLALLITFGLAVAQETEHNHTDHSDSETHEQHSDAHDGESHNDDSADHEHTTDDSDKEGHDHNAHDHSETDDAHEGHDKSETDMSAVNTVMLGEQSVFIEPLITIDGDFTLGLRPENMMMGDLELMATTPGGEMIMADTGMNMTLLELGQAEAGVYRISGSYNGSDISFPVSVYQQVQDNVEAYLILSPSPTLENRGMTEVFAYAFENGESIHDAFMVNRSMAGMQHSTDNDQVELAHTHFDDVYDATLGETPMSNQTALGFSMVGTWQVDLMIMGDTAKTISFYVEMLEN